MCNNMIQYINNSITTSENKDDNEKSAAKFFHGRLKKIAVLSCFHFEKYISFNSKKLLFDVKDQL